MELVPPSTAYKDSYLEALAELHAEGRRLDLDPDRLARDFAGLVRSLLDRADPAKTPPGRVPDTVLWLVDGDEYIGRVSIRHALDGYLLLMRGHIGYEVRPSRRHRGYGTHMLGLALQEAQKLGLDRVLLTCDPANTTSRRIIERHGGRLEDEIEAAGETVRRYWIDISGRVAPGRPGRDSESG
jgi:predicted acetyltransferase